MNRQWIVFKHGDQELLAITLKGLAEGEITATKELLAAERSIPAEEIKAFLRTKSYASVKA